MAELKRVGVHETGGEGKAQQLFEEVKLGRSGKKDRAAGGEGGLSGDFFLFNSRNSCYLATSRS